MCLLFVLWFATGVVMMYVPFPSLGKGDRIANAEPVVLSTLELTPSAALAVIDGAQVERLRLVGVLGVPRYLAELADGRVVAIAGDTAQAVITPALDANGAAKIVAHFTGMTPASMAGPFDHDQWTVHQRFDSARPFFRAALNNVSGIELYVSARTGEVLQRTTAYERGWNWVGSVVHWIYPTVLRKHFGAWDQTVWWLSLVAMVTALLGFFLGVVRMVNHRRGQGSGISPFHGWMHWHHILGLTAGVCTLTWIFSGWLSMDHGRLFSLDKPQATDTQRLRGQSLPEAVRSITVAQLAALGNPHEIEFTALGGKPFVILRGATSGTPTVDSVVVPVDRLTDAMAQSPELPDDLLRQAATKAWAGIGVVSVERIASDDAYVHLRNDRLPASARRITLADGSNTWVHVDAASGHILSVMDRSRRVYRWLYNGLHTFDFPVLNRAAPLWQILMLAALAAGFALSVTSVVLGMRRLVRPVSSDIPTKPRRS